MKRIFRERSIKNLMQRSHLTTSQQNKSEFVEIDLRQCFDFDRIFLSFSSFKVIAFDSKTLISKATDFDTSIELQSCKLNSKNSSLSRCRSWSLSINLKACKLSSNRNDSTLREEILINEKIVQKYKRELKKKNLEINERDHKLNEKNRIIAKKEIDFDRYLKSYNRVNKTVTEYWESYNKIFEELFKVKSKVWVMTRIRALTKIESAAKKSLVNITFFFMKTMTLQLHNDKKDIYDMFSIDIKEYVFDNLFHRFISNQAVLQKIMSLISVMLKETNACIIVDEQSDTNKFYTMFNASNALTIFAADRITSHVLTTSADNSDSKATHSYVHFFVLKVYKNIIRDLLLKDSFKSAIRLLHDDVDTKIFDATTLNIESLDEFRFVLSQTCIKRIIKSMKKNRFSSRDYLVCTFIVCISSRECDHSSTYKLHLVDLIDSERSSQNSSDSNLVKKFICINRSRTDLYRSMINLKTSSSCREETSISKENQLCQTSMLTILQLIDILRLCLVRCAKFLILVHLSPFLENFEITTDTLKYSNEVCQWHLIVFRFVTISTRSNCHYRFAKTIDCEWYHQLIDQKTKRIQLIISRIIIEVTIEVTIQRRLRAEHWFVIVISMSF